MNVSNYMHHVPEVQRRIRDFGIDTIILGLGPSAWLMPWMPRPLLEGIRVWGVNDGWRIWPLDDLVLIDPPQVRLAPGHESHDFVVNARPRRIWLHGPNATGWLNTLHGPMHDCIQKLDFYVRHHPQKVVRPPVSLTFDPPDTLLVSPAGATTLAWREGCRRIGVLGVDMLPGVKHYWKMTDPVDKFFVTLAKEASELGGTLINLFPGTGLKRFESWTQSASSSAPTPTSETTEPNSSSNTPSSSTPAEATSRSTGCEPTTPAGRQPETGLMAPGA